MDEKQISELLECSVCFEQLDQSCKVLPCQHTFCRRCLDEILSRKHELRCPECRTVVTTPVAELPTNILVVRILEGLKTQCHKSSNNWDGGKTRSEYNSGLGSSPSRVLGSSPHHHPHDGYGSQAGHPSRQNQPCAKALYTYESTEKEDLSFKKGDLIVLKRQIDENWYIGELCGRSGFFPANFVQVMVPLPQIPQSKALYDFDLKDENEKDCLSFKKDEIISVIRKVDENWLEGRQGDKIGIFPISFVELNDAARMLIHSKSNMTNSTISMMQSVQSTSSPTASTLPLTTVATILTSSSLTSVSTAANQVASIPSSSSLSSSFSSSVSCNNPTDNRLPTMPTTSTQNMSPQNKRHSFTSSSSCSSPLPLDSSQQRHSMEVTLAPDSSVTPTTTGSGSLPTMVSSSSSASESASFVSASCQRTGSFSPSISPTPASEVSLELQATSNHNISGGTSQSGSLTVPIYVAIYNYLPQKDDELELHKGDHYSVVEKCQDGWFKGSCIKTGLAGVFPGNYVTVYRHSSAFKPMNPNILNIRAKSPNSHPPQPSPSHAASILPPSTSNSQRSEHSMDTSITSGPPPLMPRVAKMAPGSKSRQASSHLMSIPLRSLSHPGTSSSDVSSSYPAPSSSSLMFDSSAGSMKGKPATSQVPNVYTSPHRNKTWISSHHHHHHHHHHQRVSSTQQPLSATTITPPNVVMSSSQDASSSLLQSLSKDKDKKKKKEEKKRGGLLNLLKDKKSKLMSSSSEADSQSLPIVTLDGVSHTRSGSFPAESSSSSSSHHRGGGDGSGPTIEHRKAISLDSTASLAPPIPDKPRARPPPRNKYCCVVPYPPQMNYELGLEVGDVVYVLRKRDDGWYKGTHERTGKTGMFPASFVEKCD